MEKNSFKIAFGTSVIIFILASWYLWNKKNYPSVFAIVPTNAVAIAEFEQFSDFETAIIEQEIWLEMFLDPKIPPIFQDTSKTTGLLKRSRFTTSLHITSPQDYHLLFYFPYSEEIKCLYDSLVSQSYFTERTLFGERLYESKELSIYLSNQQNLVMSTSPLLVEDVIRRQTQNRPKFYTPPSFPKLAEIATPNNNMFINFAQLNKLITVFTRTKNRALKESIQFPKMGIWAGNKKKGSWRGTLLKNPFQGRKLHFDSAQILQWVPSNISFLKHIQHENGQFLVVKSPNKPVKKSAHQALKKQYNFDTPSFYNTLEGEMVFAKIRQSNLPIQYLLLLKSNAIERSTSQLAQLPQQSIQQLSSLPLGLKELAFTQMESKVIAEILGDYSPYFKEIWCTAIGNYLVFFSSYAAIEQYIAQLENEQSVYNEPIYASFKNALPKNISAYTFRYATALFRELESTAKPSWKGLLKTYKAAILNETCIASYRLLNTDSLILETAKHSSPEYETEAVVAKKESPKPVPFKYTLNNGPLLVRNHEDWSWELLMQDRANYLTLVTEEGEKRWALPTKQGVKTKIWQIDRYANGKLQYLFAVNHQIYLIDRLGRVVKNFPLQLPFQRKVAFLTAVDYDGSKNYRILVGDYSGDVYMFSKYGTLLPNWNPKRFQVELATEVRHLRVANEDFYLILLKNGVLHAVNPKGQSHPGFPMSFGESLGTDLHLTKGSTKTTSVLSFVTQRGEKIALNLDGAVVSRELLPRLKETSVYKIHPSEGSNSSWLVSRTTKEKVDILNPSGVQVLSFDIAKKNKPLVQFFDFGGNNGIIAITNTRKGGASIYNLAGKLIGTLDKNRYPVSAISLGDYEVKIYHSVSNKLAIVSMSSI